mgnify:CR=1 FL=1
MTNNAKNIKILTVAVLLIGCLVWYLGVFRKPNQVGELVSFVDSAVGLVETKGRDAFADFRQKGGEWWKGDKYIFVYDMDANTLVLPPTPEIEGTNRWSTEDANGVFYVREMVNELENKDYVWIMYSYPKPGAENASPKVAYVRKAMVDGDYVIIGSGIYY